MKDSELIKISETRRKALKRAGMFVVPTVAVINISKLSVAASGPAAPSFTDWADKPTVD